MIQRLYIPRITFTGPEYTTHINTLDLKISPGHYWAAHSSLPESWEILVLENRWVVVANKNLGFVPDQIYKCTRPREISLPGSFVADVRSELMFGKVVDTDFGFEVPFGVVTNSFSSGAVYTTTPPSADFVPILTSEKIEFHTGLDPSQILMVDWERRPT